MKRKAAILPHFFDFDDEMIFDVPQSHSLSLWERVRERVKPLSLWHFCPLPSPLPQGEGAKCWHDNNFWQS
ncbi:hypothetical protein [Alysiella filiformis]|uniref:hypothetical protein n=1 Tax=Alysiella filiformis TaxID=194196 RepID=UPI001177FC53|nr:hypothetical protein [Alysiella filiformis]